MTTFPSEEEDYLPNVMVDIETLSLSKYNALILSIGLVEFDVTSREKPRIGGKRLIIPSMIEQIILGREISKSTQKFWRDLPAKAREHWLKGPSISLGSTCELVRDFCSKASAVWAKGPQFDLTNLEVLAEQIEQKEPLWHYRAPADVRGQCKHNPQTRIMDISKAIDMSDQLVEHEPVSDCIFQIHQLWQHWQDR